MNGRGIPPAPAWRIPPRAVRRRWLLIATAVGSALVMALSVGLESFFGQLNGNMSTEPMSILGRQPPASKAGVMNILVLGSQTRDGQGPGFGRDPGTDLSDTAMLVHLNADHSRAVVLSIPRDLIVDRPSCRERAGGDATVSGQRGAMFDSAMNLGGPACAVATVEGMSGMRVDHFIRVDFNGFRTMTNLLGGVRVCVPRPGIHDWRSHLNISAGLHVITGNEALAFVRDRHGIGNGGDLGRIEMQQMFVSSLLKKVLDAGTLTDPVTMYKLANAATRSLDTDPGLGSVQALLGLGESLRSLRLHQITFVTLPTASDPANADRLLPREPQAARLWSLLRADRPWTGHLPPATPALARANALSGADTVDGADTVAARPANAGPPGRPASQGSAPDGSGGPGVQARNAGEDICSGLPAPNTLGELGR
jgi:LCP family protein required for cell wall assembly